MIAALILMTTISFSFRYAPFVLSDFLKGRTFLEKLAAALPLCILILLIAHNLEHTGCHTPEIAALLAVIVAQVFFRSVLASMAVGVFLHQFLLRCI
ncbi:MAG: AzlD domain-containing protein [Chlamydiales bacterium]|nr:AzlD domain-containing protein [Chlamydiales bacterium]